MLASEVTTDQYFYTHTMFDKVNSVDIETEGKQLVSVSTPRPGVAVSIYEKSYRGKLIGFVVEADVVSLRNVPSARLEMDPYTEDGQVSLEGDRLHLFHLNVPEDIRRIGIGTILFNVFKEYSIEADYDKVSMRVANSGAKEFFIDNGVNPDFLHTNKFPGASTDSVVLTTEASMRRISNLAGIAETAEAMDGVFIEDAYNDVE